MRVIVTTALNRLPFGAVVVGFSVMVPAAPSFSFRVLVFALAAKDPSAVMRIFRLLALKYAASSVKEWRSVSPVPLFAAWVALIHWRPAAVQISS